MDREPPTDKPSLSEEWQSTASDLSTRERMYTVALQLYDPARVSAVAERADVSTETARDYLQWFTEMGVLKQVDSSPASYERNKSYFSWRRVQRLKDRPQEELEKELRALTEQERTYGEQFETDSPDDVDALNHGGYDEVEDVWMALQEWQTVRRRIRELEVARRGNDEPSEVSA